MLTGLVLAGSVAAKTQSFDEIDIRRIKRVGLIVSDTDDKRSRRVVVGHGNQGVARVALMDGNGRARIMLQVPSEGNPSLSFLDSAGKVIKELGPTQP